MISNSKYWVLISLIVLVYIAGMFVPLFENDSAQFAVMAMRMVQEHDFINLFKGPQEYLDKPHMHYWLAALSFKIFGIHDWAYRIPAILASLLGAYSCYGLGKLLYNKEVGKLSALVYLTAQTIVLSNIDVRTDAVLTGFTILAIWQLAAYIKTNDPKNIIWGAFGAGIAFSTKGQIALLVVGLPILCHLAYTRKWKTLINWKVPVGLAVFAITIAPMLYAYYHQFDLHPEKVIRGQDHRSGIFFIFWQQSFERLSGEGVGKNSSDYFFFFHTFLWVFLPWTVIGIASYWDKIKDFFKNKFQFRPEQEFLTLGGVTLIFIIISFAQFKLPHYLNITIPLFSVLTASYLYGLSTRNKEKTLKLLLSVQYFILGIVFVATTLICFYVFKFENLWNYLWLGILLACIAYFCFKADAMYPRIVTISVCTAVLLNAILNLHFYPSLLEYQGGSTMAQVVAQNSIPVDNIYKLSEGHTWALDFYDKKPLIISSLKGIKQKNDIWVYVTDDELEQLQKSGFDWDHQYTVDQFPITRLQAKFLNPNTRQRILDKRHLVHIY
ncbi:glycosyltransferase family 39 protein [Flavobacteriaceae bacterium F89]|uniref:Glycosyltransferase family 39 protein n=1 Tax=Cerina litoralis TaxID=2874477 RepID=A0AAE3ETN0_9FLAO|nr:glycosyltransferase family 39 protein [Cerina litoralis]MCG2460763.1 glycosyltransferase family 39 protein [Cerina litoralis]